MMMMMNLDVITIHMQYCTVQFFLLLGNPTVEKCKKLKKKIEKKKEVEELDLDNIISDSGMWSFITKFLKYG